MTAELKFKVGDKVKCNKINCPVSYHFDGEAEIKHAKPSGNLGYPYVLTIEAGVSYREDELEFASVAYAGKVIPVASFSTEDILAATSDAINPDHYKTGGMELIDVMFAKMGDQSTKDFMWGSIIKYIFRFKKKNGLQDLEKAQWYLNKLIETTKGEKNNVMGEKG